MRLLIRLFFFWLLLLGTVAAVTPANADGTHMTLTPEIKQHLLTLETVDGRKIDRASLDDRPVLVKFFASW